MKRFAIVLFVALLLVGASDPRPGLIELQLDGQRDDVLDRIEQILEADPISAKELGLEYLQGHILEQQRRLAESPDSFTAAMTSVPLLAGYSRYRLALNRYLANEPEAAAGLLATLLASDPSPLLVPAAVRWLTTSLTDSETCQLLDSWQEWNLRPAQVRQLQMAVVDCALGKGQTADVLERMRTLLLEDRTDETARHAADGLASLSPAPTDPQTSLLIGLTFHHHREFQRAIPFLASSLEDSVTATEGLRQVDRADILYSLARSHYWLGQWESAANAFAQAATEEIETDKAARALFQRGRSLALQGNWETAVAGYKEAVVAGPTSSWAAAALISAMRLEWRQGREEAALEFFRQLRSRRSWQTSEERAALFLAVSDIVRERSDRAAAWLDIARQARRQEGPEIWYWRGRLAELRDRPDEALRHYLDLLTSNSLHPLSLAARRRLQRPELEQQSHARIERLESSNRSSDLLQTWLLVERGSPSSNEIQQRLEDQWRRNSRVRPYLEMKARAPDQWKIWQHRVRQPEAVLLALGITETMSPLVRRAFPLDDPSLALAGSRLLSASGLHQRSLYFAEVVSHRLPRGVPHHFFPGLFRQLLYPRPYAYLLEQQASRFGVDPHLLTAIIREESRFDPMAVSGAAARGLNQFVWSTARRLGQKLELGDLDPTDLHRPDISITLGAAYLAELADHFDGKTVQVVAAYNAGEDLARLWQAYCFSQEPEEYFSKVGFRQTRGYLEKVLTSRAQYAEIYSGEE